MNLARRFRTLVLIGLLMLAGHLSPTVNYYEALVSLSVARTLRINGFPGTAIQFYSFAMYCAPQASQVVQARGVAHYQMHDYKRAITDLTASLTLDPNDAVSYGYRGSAYSALRLHDEAIADKSKGIEIEPDANGYAQRAAIYYHAGRFEEAARDYSKAQHLAAGRIDYVFYRGLAFAKARLDDKARADFETVIAREPESRWARHARNAIRRHLVSAAPEMPPSVRNF